MEFKDSRTFANLMAAFAGESQARNKYTFYAQKAKENGYEQIAELFCLTADNEKAHAELWFKLLHEGVPETNVNLADAADGEHFEWEEMYAQFAAEAREEGYTHIANRFEKVAEIEKMHENRFRALLKNVENKTVFSADGEAIWICRNCGNLHIGKEAPSACEVCGKAQSYFEQKAENY